MQARKIVPAAALLLLLAAPAWSADTYQIDPVHSTLGFSVRHLMLSNVKGRFNDVSGTILYDEQDITKSSVKVTIQAASINTENQNRDNDLRSPNFFDVANFPTLSFESKRVEKRGDAYVCLGTLTMHGVAKEVEIPFRILGKVKDPWGNTRIGIEGGLSVNRQDYGIAYNKTFEGGGLVVGNEVKIELNVEAVMKPAPPAGK